VPLSEPPIVILGLRGSDVQSLGRLGSRRGRAPLHERAVDVEADAGIQIRCHRRTLSAGLVLGDASLDELADERRG
jgi:hypothetical protein